ncbi:MAG: Uma2 family endonuclease [Scytonema sp. PMC 1069.18]|nr:Uma2 family endonuclease [Scytonema sp. PMC 1069.18]MEC4880237.1 Uma2 family endonuclease [Scytonema sp. PMC 1070.18]
MKNFQEYAQSILITDSILPRLQELHPDGKFCIGNDCPIYWRVSESLEKGSTVPDWFYVSGVSPTLDGEVKPYYDFWQDLLAPKMVIEFIDEDDEEEWNKTPYEGKFWIYETVIKPSYYVIFEVKKASVEIYELFAGQYIKVSPNSRGHYPIKVLDTELGIWQGHFLLDKELSWLRWWDEAGNLLLTGDERAKAERQRAENAEKENARLREQLGSLGVDPDTMD